MPERPKKFQVRFLPEGISARVRSGSTLLEAAHQAGVYLASLCGGMGYCGKCRIVLEKGSVKKEPTALLSPEDEASGVILACQSQVIEDIVVSVPEETRLAEGRILEGEEAPPTACEEVRVRKFEYSPLARKIHLKLERPTIDAPIPDRERLVQGLKSVGEQFEPVINLEVLKELSSVLWRDEWQGEVTVSLALDNSSPQNAAHAKSRILSVAPGDETKISFGVAMDVGTTTLVAHLVHLPTGRTIASEAKYNSQMQYGEDYIQRIMYIAQNDALEELQRLVIDDLNELIGQATSRASIRPEDILVATATGNTAMLHILLGLDPARIRKEPYIPSANFTGSVSAQEIGLDIHPRGLIYPLPSVAAYIGADITAGAVAVGVDHCPHISLFIDLGTNGEVVLGNREWLVAASCSAGPAFEGSGVKHGMRAAAGAIEELAITSSGEVRYKTVGEKPPRGICGSGLLDTMAELFRTGILNRSGVLQEGPAGKRLREGEEGPEFLLVDKSETSTHRDIVITQPDIDNLMRSKAAVYAAVSLLMEVTQMTSEKLDHIFLAGGFGSFLDVKKVVLIGMLPDVPREKIYFAGNTSIAGAKLALLSTQALEAINKVAGRMTYVDLMTNPKFMDEFVAANFLPHTQVERFPSVEKFLASGGKK